VNRIGVGGRLVSSCWLKLTGFLQRERERERERVLNFIGIQTDGHVELKSFCVYSGERRSVVCVSELVCGLGFEGDRGRGRILNRHLLRGLLVWRGRACVWD
jgi:hypothetical protein